jgi:hypothetical protein
VQFSRFRFFMEELCSRRCSDGQSGLPAEGVDSNSVAKYERVDNDIKRIHTTLERLEGVRDVISLPDFRSEACRISDLTTSRPSVPAII